MEETTDNLIETSNQFQSLYKNDDYKKHIEEQSEKISQDIRELEKELDHLSL